MTRRIAFSLFSFLFVGTLIAQSSKIKAERMGTTDTTAAVACFAKLELGVRLPISYEQQINNFLTEKDVSEKQKINPFLEWELDIEAIFTHVTSGTTKKVDAFYYRDFERDQAANSWKDLQTRVPMRVRFSPTLPGAWTCVITMKVDGKELGQQCNYSFKVVEAGKPGFVTVHSNKRNFTRGGRLIYPLGANFPSPTRTVRVYHTNPKGGADLFQPNETHKVTTLSDWQTYHNDVDGFIKAGGKYIRTLQSGWSTLIEYEKKGNYYDRLNYAWEQDQLIENCEKNGVLVQFDLMQQEPFMKYGNYDMFDWDFTHYNGDGSYFYGDIFPAYCYADGKNKEPHDMFLNEEDLKYHQQRNRYYFSRYGYSTTIYLFELLSEPWHVDQIGGQKELYMDRTPEGEVVRRAVQNYHERMAAFIKQDMQHTDHLIGVDILMPNYFETEPLYDKSVLSPLIDVVAVNYYASVPEKLVITKSGDPIAVQPNENSFYHGVSWLQSQAMKPIIISEGGAGDDVDDCSNFVQQNLDMAAFGFTGLAGFNSWVGWANGQTVTWPGIVGSEKFMNGELVQLTLLSGNGEWKQGRQAERRAKDEKKVKELQFYVSGDGKYAVGYVKNRSYNYYTMRTGETCANGDLKNQVPFNGLVDLNWDDGAALKVAGLEKRKKYVVRWYSYLEGEQVEIGEFKAKGGKMTLKFPTLRVVGAGEKSSSGTEQPLMWFSVEPLSESNKKEVEEAELKKKQSQKGETITVD